MTLIYPRNRKILAYLREHEGDRILCVANLADSAQAVELDLARFRGMVPIELTGRSAFPPVGDLPYMLTLPAYGFYWFLLTDEEQAPSWHATMPEILPEFITLTSRDGRIDTALTGRERSQLETDVLPQFLPLQRWFGAKDARIDKVAHDAARRAQPGRVSRSPRSTSPSTATTQRYFLPISARWGDENLRPGAPKLSYTLAKIRRGPRVGALIDGAYDEQLAARLLEEMRQDREIDGPAGKVRFHATDGLRRDPGSRRAAPARRRAEQRLDRLRRQGDPQGLPAAARRRAAGRRGRRAS